MNNEEAISHIRDILAENNSIKPSMVVFEAEKEALRVAIKALEQQPKIGYWIAIDYQRGIFRCSACHTEGYVNTQMYKPIWEYCPNCGAKMSESEDKE